MLTKTHITFSKNWVEINAKYVCKCGHTFYRKNRDWFTVSPFNTMDYNASKNKIKKEQSKKVRDCPKCGTEVKPIIL